MSIESEGTKAMDSQVGALSCEGDCSAYQGRAPCPLTCPFKVVRPASRLEEFLGSVCLLLALGVAVGAVWLAVHAAKAVIV